MAKSSKVQFGWENAVFDQKPCQEKYAIILLNSYVASYLYEIGQGEVYDDFVVLIAQLGGSKSGDVTRHYTNCITY